MDNTLIIKEIVPTVFPAERNGILQQLVEITIWSDTDAAFVCIAVDSCAELYEAILGSRGIDKDINLAMAANNVFLTPQYLSKIFLKVFKLATGFPPSSYKKFGSYRVTDK